MLDAPGKCIDCGAPGKSRYPPHTPCLCAEHQAVADILNQTVDEAVPRVHQASLVVCEEALRRVPRSLVVIKALGVRVRRLRKDLSIKPNAMPGGVATSPASTPRIGSG